MANKQQNKRKKAVSPAVSRARRIAGVVLLSLGVLTVFAMASNVQSAFFTTVKHVLQGLGGNLCVFISVLLIWAGFVLAFLSDIWRPLRPFWWALGLYMCILALINLLSRVGDSGFFINYCIDRRQHAPDAAGFGSVISVAYQLCSQKGVLGGALGMILAWPAFTYLQTVFGTVVLIGLCILCVLMISRFDVAQVAAAIKEGMEKHRQKAEQKRLEAAQRQQREEQEQQQQLYQQMFAGRYVNQPQPMPSQPAAQPMMNASAQRVQEAPAYQQPTVNAPNNNVELYDETVMDVEQPRWFRSGKKKEPRQYQTSMTFTPSEVGMADEPSAPAGYTATVTGNKRNKANRLEEIRQKKAGITQWMTEGEQEPLQPAYEEPEVVDDGFAPLIDDSSAYRRPEDEDETYEPALQMPEHPQEHTPGFAPLVGRKKSMPEKAPVVQEEKSLEKKPYSFPPVNLLDQRIHRVADTSELDNENGRILENTLSSFGIPAKVQSVTHGPAITRYALGLTQSGINVKRILNIADNIALDLAANGAVRIESQIPGTNLFGVEVPNQEMQSVRFAQVLMSPEMQNATSPLAVGLGHDITGKPVICDLAKMPHLLIAGQTGSGKSVCVNTIINSLLFRTSPQEVRMIMIDPKVVELQGYNKVPHLLIPVVSDPHKAVGALAWAVAEMEDRYNKLKSKGVRELSAYNAKLAPGEEPLPRLVIVIDELADLIMASKRDVEESIIRLAQKARASGIHMIVATQRPTVDVITGLIKSNIPSRIAFAVASNTDSRNILDRPGADKLLGRGDMLYFPTGASAPVRVQGCFLSDTEIENVTDYLAEHCQTDFDPNIMEALEQQGEEESSFDDNEAGADMDPLLEDAIELVLSEQQASISMLQRRMRIGQPRAGRLMDDMAARGIVSKSLGSKAREVLMTMDDYLRMKNRYDE